MIIIERTMSATPLRDVEALPVLLFEGERYAHQFRISPPPWASFDGHQITSRFIRNDRENIAPDGVLLDGTAVVTLTPSCYDAPGAFKFFIYAVSDSETVCIYACAGNVEATVGENGPAPEASVIIEEYPPDELAEMNQWLQTAKTEMDMIRTGVRTTFRETYAAQALKSYDFVVPKGQDVRITVSDWETEDRYMAVAFYVAGSTTNQQVTVLTNPGTFVIRTEKDYVKLAVWTRSAATFSIDAEVLGLNTMAGRTDAAMDLIGYPVYVQGSYSGTRIVTIHADLPAGDYLLSVEDVSSSDTDTDYSLVNFSGDNNSVMVSVPRGTAYKTIVTLPQAIDTVYLYASSGYAPSQGDSFSFAGLSIGTASGLHKYAMDGTSAKKSLYEHAANRPHTSNASGGRAETPLKIYPGQTACVVVSGINATSRGYWVGFGTQHQASGWSQPTHISGPGLTRIQATGEYEAVFVIFDSGDVTTAKVTAYVDGDQPRYGTFSILGDSYSTFAGFIPQANAAWYPEDAQSSSNDCLAVTDTWWYRFAKEYGCALQLNESYSGTPICNDGYGSGTADASDTSFIARMTRLPQSELILIFGGTNDSWIGVGLGEYKYSGWTAADLSTFRPAMAYMLDYLTQHHVGAKVVFIKNTGLSADLSASIDVICDHYGVSLLSLADTVQKVGGHPDTAGMTEICAQLISHLAAG